MIDTSVMVAGLVEGHPFHTIARPYVLATLDHTAPGIVLAETWAVLRRGPWRFRAADVAQMLAPWILPERIIATPPEVYATVLRTGSSLDLGGNVHDVLVAQTCALVGEPLATLDRRQAAVARTIPGLSVTLLLPENPRGERN